MLSSKFAPDCHLFAVVFVCGCLLHVYQCFFATRTLNYKCLDIFTWIKNIQKTVDIGWDKWTTSTLAKWCIEFSTLWSCSALRWGSLSTWWCPCRCWTCQDTWRLSPARRDHKPGRLWIKLTEKMTHLKNCQKHYHSSIIARAQFILK